MRCGMAAALMVAGAMGSGNMNGKYLIASGGKQAVAYNDDYASKGHEYFDVWAPEIATHYGEVFWTSQGNQPLPDAIVKRFAGKTIAITGYEQDQVMVTPTGKPGVNPDQDVSVPINWAYNHHYMAWMTGKYSEWKEVVADPNDVSAHGSPMKHVTIDTPDAAFRADPSIPTSQMFSEGNGGESRKSYHGYPDGFAQLIDSPTEWHLTPMQIDTRNRDCGVTIKDLGNCTKFTPGPEPKQARYGLGIPEGSNYSGILECPCNSRFGGDPAFYPDAGTKIIVSHVEAVGAGCKVSEAIGKADDCFTSVAALGLDATSFKNVTTSSAQAPAGCSYVVSKSGEATVTFNSQSSSTAPCNSPSLASASDKTVIGVTLSVNVDTSAGSDEFSRSPKGEYCSKNKEGILKVFPMASEGEKAAEATLSACEAFCKGSDQCQACSVDCAGDSRTQCNWNAIPQCGSVKTWEGIIPGDVSRKQGGMATITLSGPASGWFAVGLNAQEMSDQPYTLIANSSGVIEQKLGTCGSEADHCPGTQLSTSVKVVSNSVSGGVRTVTVTRPLVGATSNHYTFDLVSQATIPFIAAIGNTQVFAYHKAHIQSTLSFAAADGKSPMCVCDVGADGKLCETNGTNCDSFVKTCIAPPAGDLLAQANPTCNSRQYAGGLRCCHHGRIMLDDDQEIRPELLRYHMKFRFWFQEYTPANSTHNASHSNLPRIYQQTEANAGEYDIPPAFRRNNIPIPGYPNWPENKMTPGTSCTGTCPDGPDCECIHTIVYKWTVSNMRLIYAGGHCHAPSCISLELYRNDTGHEMELLCAQIPVYGTGNITHDKYDEAGYVSIPPCLWGDDKGLEPSILLPENTPVVSIKKNRNTKMGHFGEMASWQMRGVNF